MSDVPPSFAGKTTLIIYLLLRRLEQKLPTAIQFEAKRFLIFDSLGASVFEAHERSDRLMSCVALVDSDAEFTMPSIGIRRQAKLIVHTTLPIVERYRSWTKYLFFYVIEMSLPTALEIAILKYVQILWNDSFTNQANHYSELQGKNDTLSPTSKTSHSGSPLCARW